MEIQLGCEWFYACPQQTPMILTLEVHYDRVCDLALKPDLRVAPSFRDIVGQQRDKEE